MLLADNYALGRKTSPTTASAFDERKIVTAPTPAKSRKKPRALITGGLTPRLLAIRRLYSGRLHRLTPPPVPSEAPHGFCPKNSPLCIVVEAGAAFLQKLRPGRPRHPRSRGDGESGRRPRLSSCVIAGCSARTGTSLKISDPVSVGTMD
jgi:hypothetical protein